MLILVINMQNIKVVSKYYYCIRSIGGTQTKFNIDNIGYILYIVNGEAQHFKVLPPIEK